MAKITVKLNKAEYKVVCSEINEWYGISLTPEQMEKLLSDNILLLVQIAEDVVVCGTYRGIGSTSIREEILNHISQKILKEDWPCYGHSITIKLFDNFIKRFAKACKSRGYKFNREQYIR